MSAFFGSITLTFFLQSYLVGPLPVLTNAIIGEAGQEAIIPLTDDRALNNIAEAITGALQNQPINNVLTDDRPINIGLSIDGEALNATITENIDNKNILINSQAVVNR